MALLLLSPGGSSSGCGPVSSSLASIPLPSQWYTSATGPTTPRTPMPSLMTQIFSSTNRAHCRLHTLFRSNTETLIHISVDFLRGSRPAGLIQVRGGRAECHVPRAAATGAAAAILPAGAVWRLLRTTPTRKLVGVPGVTPLCSTTLGAAPQHQLSTMSRHGVSLWTPYADDVPLDLSKFALDAQSAACHAPQPPVPLPPYYLPYGGYYGAPHPAPGESSLGCPVSRHCVAPHLVLSPPAYLSPLRAPDNRPYDAMDADALSDDPDFQESERRGLEVLAAKNGGALVGDNPRMRRSVRASSAAAADAAYRSQRERSNRAAKQSRDRRKLHLSLKAAYLQRQVVAL